MKKSVLILILIISPLIGFINWWATFRILSRLSVFALNIQNSLFILALIIIYLINHKSREPIIIWSFLFMSILKSFLQALIFLPFIIDFFTWQYGYSRLLFYNLITVPLEIILYFTLAVVFYKHRSDHSFG